MSHLFFATAIHAIFSQYGDILMACLNLLNVPIRKIFDKSMSRTYGLHDENLELLYSACASTMLVGLMLGFLAMGQLIDRLGTKTTGVTLRCLLGILSSTAMITSFVSGRFEFFVLGHFFSGILSALKVALFIYVADYSPDDKRGSTSMVVNSGGVIAILIVTPLCMPDLLGSDERWFILPTACLIMATTHLLIAGRFPQSPRQLFIKDQNAEGARAALKYFYGKQYDIDSVIHEMEMEKRYEAQETLSLGEILKDPPNRFSLLIVLLCAFVPVFSALNIKLQYLMSMFGSYGLTQSEAVIAMTLMNAVAAPLCFVAPWLIERFGRRKTFLMIISLCCLEWVALGGAQLSVDKQVQNTTISWLCGVLGATIGQCALNMGLLIMSPMMISEICPYNTRPAIAQFTQVLPLAVAIVEVFTFPTLVANLGSLPFFVLAVCCVILAVVLEKKMLETAGMPLDMIIRKIHQAHLPSSNSLNGSSSYGAFDMILGTA